MFLVHSAHIHNSMEGEVSFLCTFCDEIKLFLAGIMFSLLDMVNLSGIKALVDGSEHCRQTLYIKR